jgi:zinc D-Ala-D-Ala dipeptidase
LTKHIETRSAGSVKRLVGAVLAGLLGVFPAALAAQTAASVESTVVAPDSVARRMLADVRTYDSTIVVEVHYATSQNFTGAPLPGYDANRVFLRTEAARALARVQKRLATGGMGLKVFDGYRPVRATRAMVDWAHRTGREWVLRDGYVASHSRHNLGLAVDLTLRDRVTGMEIPMGTPYDTFSPEAHTANATGRTARYRQLLVKVMEEEGFKNYEHEWWHFSYEVRGETPAFDLPVSGER